MVPVILPGRVKAAQAHLAAALDLFRQVGNRQGEAAALQQLAATHLDTGDLTSARALAESALGIARGSREGNVEIDAHNTLGDLYLRQDAAREAVAEYRQALRLATARGSGSGRSRR